MRVNEFRVGNWIYEEGRHYRQWEPSDFTDYLNRDGEEISDKIEGIPLTPEILMECGFVSGRKNGYWIKPGKDYDINLEEINECFIFSKEPDGYGLASIKYLHQLHNLYFALTGTELEYNPIKETVQRKIDSDFTKIKITDDTIFGRLK